MKTLAGDRGGARHRECEQRSGAKARIASLTRQRTIVAVTLPGPSTNEIFALSHDNRTIYYGAARAESDIWILERR